MGNWEVRSEKKREVGKRGEKWKGGREGRGNVEVERELGKGGRKKKREEEKKGEEGTSEGREEERG